MSVQEDLKLIKRYQKEMKLIGHAAALMQWDQETKMPKKGTETRAESSAFLAGLAHEKAISNEFFDAVKRLHASDIKGDDRLIVNILLEDLEKSRKLPKEFVEEMEHTTSSASQSWIEARNKKDFKIFQPHLEKIIDLKRKESKYYNFPGHPYDGLLDNFEEGMTVEILRPKFAELKKGLVELLRKIENSKEYKKQKLVLTKKKFPQEIQMELVKDVVKRIGLSEDSTRIDFSEHPFSIDLSRKDVRLTTAIRSNPLYAFSSSVHEAGHGLYMLHMPQEHFYDVLGSEPSTGIHESQSRFWENMVGHNEYFWKFYFPMFSKKFKLGKNSTQWYKEVNQVSPGKIRTEADEVHYCLHIILRFELELALLEGSLKVSDLPKVWNQKMKELFGVTPKDDKEGVLQDVHWSNGYIGYFPTYALGTIYAAQLYAQMIKDMPKAEKEISQGNFTNVRNWLIEKVHKHGRRFLAEDLMKKVCGEGLNVQVYLDYLNKKYQEIYDF